MGKKQENKSAKVKDASKSVHSTVIEAYLVEAFGVWEADRTSWVGVLVGGWDNKRGRAVANETGAVDPAVGVNRGSGVNGVAAFGPDASEVGVLSAGEMSMSWLGRSNWREITLR